jgi:hypothetical protein
MPVRSKSPDQRIPQERKSQPAEADYQSALMRRYMSSPFVNAAAEFEESERADRKRRGKSAERTSSHSRRPRHRHSRRDSLEAETHPAGVPRTVSFRDKIKTFPKFNKPDGNQTWTDYVQIFLDVVRLYRVPSEEWAEWLVLHGSIGNPPRTAVYTCVQSYDMLLASVCRSR